MRCMRLVAVLLAALFVLSAVGPVFAGDGRFLAHIEQTFRDHPWQDDNSKDGKLKVKPFTFVLGPWVININYSLNLTAQKAAPSVPAKVKPTTTKLEKAK